MTMVAKFILLLFSLAIALSEFSFAKEKCNRKIWSTAKSKCALAGKSHQCVADFYVAYASRESGVTCAQEDLRSTVKTIDKTALEELNKGKIKNSMEGLEQKLYLENVDISEPPGLFMWGN